MAYKMTDYKKVYLASAQAYSDGDIDKMMDCATEDFSWYNIEPDGPRLLSDTKEKAKVGMQYILDNPDYLSGHVDFAKAFGNVVVVVETDRIRKDGEEVIQKRMSVYQCKDGKLHRCLSLPIEDDTAQPTS
jgi:ketosteroid isomerase-like protein